VCQRNDVISVRRKDKACKGEDEQDRNLGTRNGIGNRVSASVDTWIVMAAARNCTTVKSPNHYTLFRAVSEDANTTL
jgi:hypothetical protein